MILRMNRLITIGVLAMAVSCAVPTAVYATGTSTISAGAGKVVDTQDETLLVAEAQTGAEIIEVGISNGSEEEGSADEESENLTEAPENEAIAGYTNLGIAHVDNYLNVRKDPKEDGEILGKMPKGAGCEVIDVTNGWAHIKSGKIEGYVSTEFLYMDDVARERAQEFITLTATVNTTTLFVREAPSTNASVITMVPIEEELEVLEQLEGWCKIALDDEEGYVSTEYVDIAEKLGHAITLKELRYGEGVSDVRVAMVNYAKQFLGNRYVWGGTSLTNGTDCSGFTMRIYEKYGYSLPRVSRDQARTGKKITSDQMKPGDLIFYGKGGTINHVAMYIGGGQVIHASGRRTGIKISNAFYRTPLAIRRIIND